ncbi:hypothetical protein EYF80_013001 [Liparis tanakae]|uniref:Uncharacterized protein n=1 Tax=Liparis tanakae TaxID=230148 RepID=A0A4Z2IHG0_9TELE|nr:hypothetical protein EYF80_013001 [Liparis tanakae]
MSAKGKRSTDSGLIPRSKRFTCAEPTLGQWIVRLNSGDSISTKKKERRFTCWSTCGAAGINGSSQELLLKSLVLYDLQRSDVTPPKFLTDPTRQQTAGPAWRSSPSSFHPFGLSRDKDESVFAF